MAYIEKGVGLSGLGCDSCPKRGMGACAPCLAAVGLAGRSGMGGLVWKVAAVSRASDGYDLMLKEVDSGFLSDTDTGRTRAAFSVTPLSPGDTWDPSWDPNSGLAPADVAPVDGSSWGGPSLADVGGFLKQGAGVASQLFGRPIAPRPAPSSGWSTGAILTALGVAGAAGVGIAYAMKKKG